MSQPHQRRPLHTPPAHISSSPAVRRLQTPQERFGEPETPVAAENSLEDEVDIFAPLPKGIAEEDDTEFSSHSGLKKSAHRHEKKKFVRAPAKNAAKREVKHFERHALPGHEGANLESRPKRAPRAQSRRKKVQRFAGRMILLGALFFAVQLGVAAFSAPQFAVSAVQLEGLNDTPESAVHPFAQKLIGENVLRADRLSIAKSIATIPTIQTAKIERVWSFPPKMRVVVTERQPLARVGGGNSWWVVDETGFPFRRANKPTDEEFYALTAPQFAPQEHKRLPAQAWQKAREVLLALKSDNARKDATAWELRRVYLDKNGLASLRLSDPRHAEMLVRLGEDDFGRKLARARESLDYLHRTGRVAGELNLISFQFPRWKPKIAQTGETGALAHKSDSAGRRFIG